MPHAETVSLAGGFTRGSLGGATKLALELASIPAAFSIGSAVSSILVGELTLRLAGASLSGPHAHG